ncbi:hypothetical protein GR226_04140 [Rhizobium leguminosarum]|uniref:hypothetical protein n=1 Tax=Rhizobium ruizarguesonis TaxID=2081791 RepID=UPI0013D94C8F|nr:hypothetical protein [Rhizobium ruizarguesonis]NEH82927.1 hypothetical protein [Rhizobium ruizarguesonis]
MEENSTEDSQSDSSTDGANAQTSSSGGPAKGGGNGVPNPASVTLPPGRWDDFRSFLCLSLVCFGSVILVLIVAILIALMQFQSRLALAQPILTAGRLIYFVGLEDAMTDSNQKIEIKGNELSKVSLLLSKNQAELNFRMNRLCKTFSTADKTQNLVEKCQAFLARVPFDFMPEQYESMQKAFALMVDRPAKDNAPEAPYVIPRLDTEALKKISEQFFEYMGDGETQGPKSSKYEILYSTDLSLIAYLNQASALTLKPRYELARADYTQACKYRQWVSQQIRIYREVDDISCEGSLDQRLQVPGPPDSATPSLPVPTEEGKVASENGATATSDANKVADPQPVKQPVETTGTDHNGSGSGKNSEKPGSNEVQPGTGGAEAKQNSSTLTDPGLIAVALGQGYNPKTSTFAEQQKYYELVSSYRFYNIISQKLLESLIMSPSEFIALLIVCFAGMLGSFLKIVFEVHVSNRNPDFRDLIVPPILGLICSLVLYILLRAGFIAVTDHAEQTGSANLSPFVIAFVSLTAGLLSNRAVAVLERSSSTLLGGSATEDKSRWAVGLREALVEKQMTVEQLATRLHLLTKSVSDWVDEIEPVPSVNQRDISLILNMPARSLFTDLNP